MIYCSLKYTGDTLNIILNKQYDIIQRNFSHYSRNSFSNNFEFQIKLYCKIKQKLKNSINQLYLII